MSEVKHDPDFPFVVVANGGGVEYAKFYARLDAEQWVDSLVSHSGLTVIDTTPKPRIPRGVNFIAWGSPDDLNYAARRGDWWRIAYGDIYETSEDRLIQIIGDAEIILLRVEGRA